MDIVEYSLVFTNISKEGLLLHMSSVQLMSSMPTSFVTGMQVYMEDGDVDLLHASLRHVP